MRKFLIGLVCFILSFLITGASLIICTKDLIQEQILTEAIKNTVVENSEIENKEEVNKTIDKLLNNKNIESIFNNVLSDYANGEVSDTTLDQIMTFIKDNKSEISTITGSDTNVDELTSPESKEEMRDTLNKTFKKAGSDNTTVKTAVNTYTTITTHATLKNAIMIAVGLILLLALLTWSLYKWMKPLSKVFISSSIVVFILFGLSFYLVKLIQEKTNITITFDNKLMIIVGASELGIGILLYVLYYLLTKIKWMKPIIAEPSRAVLPTDNLPTDTTTNIEKEEPVNNIFGGTQPDITHVTETTPETNNNPDVPPVQEEPVDYGALNPQAQAPIVEEQPEPVQPVEPQVDEFGNRPPEIQPLDDADASPIVDPQGNNDIN